MAHCAVTINKGITANLPLLCPTRLDFNLLSPLEPQFCLIFKNCHKCNLLLIFLEPERILPDLCSTVFAHAPERCCTHHPIGKFAQFLHSASIEFNEHRARPMPFRLFWKKPNQKDLMHPGMQLFFINQRKTDGKQLPLISIN
jgi:hypothetical protein